MAIGYALLFFILVGLTQKSMCFHAILTLCRALYIKVFGEQAPKKRAETWVQTLRTTTIGAY